MDIVKIAIENILYPMMELKNGNRIRKYTKELINSGLAGEQTAALRDRRLRDLLSACKRHVPAYKDAEISDDDIRRDPLGALSKFPVLTKREFQMNGPERYISNAAEKTGLISNSSGGSTGQPVKFYMDRYTVEHYEAARWRGLSWHGITPGSRSVMIWGNPIELEANKEKIAKIKNRFLKNRIIISAYALSAESIGEHVRTINRYRPEYIYGYSSALYGFAALLKNCPQKIKVRLKAVVSTAETLHDEQREYIGEAFGAPVVNEYGARDAGILAYECASGHMHISSENVVIEILDPVTLKPLPAGESGLVVTTDLNNLSMPRLRYVLGDMATLSDGVCGCGVNLPLIESVDGRQDDLFQLPNGTLVHGNFINQLSRQYDSILQFQLTQQSVTDAVLRIVKKGDINEFVGKVCGQLPGVNVTVEIVDEIPPAKSGKFRYAIREFELGGN